MNHSDSFQKHEQNHTIAIFHSSFISFEDLGEFVNVLKYYNFIVISITKIDIYTHTHTYVYEQKN